MSIAGRSIVDVVFHDTSGTSLKVLSLESTDSQTSGIVAVIDGTHGPSSHTISKNAPGYLNADGVSVSFSNVSRIALKSDRPMKLATHQDAVVIQSDANRVAFSDASMTSGNLTLTPLYTSGTAAYTVFLYGT